MNRLSTSSSSAGDRFPRPTPAAIVAAFVLAVARIAIGIADQDVLFEIDSRRMHNMLVTDLKAERAAEHPPDVIILGTSRTVPMDGDRVAGHLNLPLHAVANLSSPGADFVFMEILLQRNPEVLRNVKAVVIDLAPFHVMAERSERGEFFLRFASIDRRLHAKDLASKAAGIGHLVLPAVAGSRTPFQWRRGLARLALNPSERDAYLRGIQIADFADWSEVVDRLQHAEQAGEQVPETAKILFPPANLMPNQLRALRNIIEMTPETCDVLGVWLPYRKDFDQHINTTAARSASRAMFDDAIAAVQHPRFSIVRYEHPDEIGLATNDFTADGAHFATAGARKLERAYAALLKRRLGADAP